MTPKTNPPPTVEIPNVQVEPALVTEIAFRQKKSDRRDLEKLCEPTLVLARSAVAFTMQLAEALDDLMQQLRSRGVAGSNLRHLSHSAKSAESARQLLYTITEDIGWTLTDARNEG